MKTRWCRLFHGDALAWDDDLLTGAALYYCPRCGRDLGETEALERAER